MFKKKQNPEDLEKEEIFKDVVSKRNSHEENQKQIKKYKRNMEHKFFRYVLLTLLISSAAFISIDVYVALTSDEWTPLRLEDLLPMIDMKLRYTDIYVIDWFLGLPMFAITFIIFIILLFIF